MQTIKEHVRVGAGGRIVLERPEMAVGTEAEVIIMLGEAPASPRAEEHRPLASFLGTGQGCFSTAAEVDAFLRAERDAWDS